MTRHRSYLLKRLRAVGLRVELRHIRGHLIQCVSLADGHRGAT